MDLDQLKKILDLVREHELAEFEIEQEGLRLKVRKDSAGTLMTLPAAAPPNALPSAPLPAPATAPVTTPWSNRKIALTVLSVMGFMALVATIFALLGISPDTELPDPQGRPVRIGGPGKAIQGGMA